MLKIPTPLPKQLASLEILKEKWEPHLKVMLAAEPGG